MTCLCARTVQSERHLMCQHKTIESDNCHKTTASYHTIQINFKHLSPKPHDNPDILYKMTRRGSIQHSFTLQLCATETSSTAIMKTLLLASALFAGLFGSLAAVPVPVPVPVPYHAFCRTLW